MKLNIFLNLHTHLYTDKNKLIFTCGFFIQDKSDNNLVTYF